MTQSSRNAGKTAWRMVIMLVLVAVLLGAIFGFQIFRGVMMRQYFATRGVPAQTVSTMTAKVEDWAETLSVVGSLRAQMGTDIAPEVAGRITTLAFESGDDIKAGDVLLQLRADDDIARLNSLKAAAELARLTYERQSKLVGSGTASQSILDTASANYKSALAQVAEQQALIDKKTLRAPFSGRIGVRLADLGQYVAAGTKITTLQAVDPIFFDFNVPEAYLSRLKSGDIVIMNCDAWPGENFRGTIEALDSKVDPDTRNIAVRAVFTNGDKRLLPGMYATGTITIGKPVQYVTVPQTAITFNPYGETVYTVDGVEGALIAREGFVTTGPRRGDQVAVLKGLAPGAEVVVAGTLKLRPNMPITINNSVAVSNNPSPKPVQE